MLQCTYPRQLLQSGQRLNVGDKVYTSDFYASIKQESNGNLVVRRTTDNSILCESGVNAESSSVPYFSSLHGDGHLITWSSSDQQHVAPPIWKSVVVGPTTSTYFLAVNCDDSVSIYQDSVFEGSILWTCPGFTKRTLPQGTPPPTPAPTPAPPMQDPITTFCVVADAPYSYTENLKLLDQVDNMDPDCEFVAHLGDIRSARQFDTCVKETYTNASLIMKRSQKPVLMMIGGK
jgi:hypothetical protein